MFSNTIVGNRDCHRQKFENETDAKAQDRPTRTLSDRWGSWNVCTECLGDLGASRGLYAGIPLLVGEHASLE